MVARWVGEPVRLETARLVMDGHRAEDFEGLAALFGDAEVMRHIGGAALGRKEAWRRLLRYRGTWPVLGYGKWVIRERANGRFLGQCGFFRDERGFPPPYAAMPEAGWALLPAAQGKGFAAEAMSAALAWLDAAGHAACLCLIDEPNERSLRLAKRCGFMVEGRATQEADEPLLLVRRASVVNTLRL
jgi:RimJ/RimL family protein N-acetyltransferase